MTEIDYTTDFIENIYQVARDNALKDASKVEEYKDMNLDLKKALAQAQVLLDEAHTHTHTHTHTQTYTHTHTCTHT